MCQLAISQAAQQGNLGNTSEGQIEILLSLGNSVRLGGLQDFHLVINSASEDFTASQSICIGLLNDTRSYSLRAVGQGSVNAHRAFSLNNLKNQSIPFRVFFKDKFSPVRQEMMPGNRLENLSIGLTALDEFQAYINLIDCLYYNATLEIQIDAEDIASAATGSYSGVVTLTLIPE